LPIAGAVVVPMPREEKKVKSLLKKLKGVEIKGVGSKGIAIVLEAKTTEDLESISKKIEKWNCVIDFQLVYFNVEDIK